MAESGDKISLTAIILTLDEEMHIARCIASVKNFARRVIVIDSFSRDETAAIARAAGAEVIQHEFVSHAQQFQWVLDNCDVATEWTLRLDADEYLEPALQEEIRARLPNLPEEISGVYLRRRIVFLGRAITHGFFYPHMVLRLFRTRRGSIEQRWMDEHIAVTPARTIAFKTDLVDENLKDLTWYIGKMNAYASREVRDVFEPAATLTLSGPAAKRRVAKRLYYRTPAGWRGIAYFLFRYFIGLGFLDGREGLYFHFLQACWYRILVDAKLHERRKAQVKRREGRPLSG